MLHLPLADKILFAIIFVTMETDLSLVISAQFLFFFSCNFSLSELSASPSNAILSSLMSETKAARS